MPIINPFISFSYTSTELQWNPTDLGTSVVRVLYSPFSFPNSVTESSSSITQIDDISGNGFNLTGINGPNWNTSTNTVEIDHTSNQRLECELNSVTDTDVGHIFVYGELGSYDPFGRHISLSDGTNDSNSPDYDTFFLRNGGGSWEVFSNGSELMTTVAPSGFNLLEARSGVSSTGLYVNGVEQVSEASASNINFQKLQIGRAWTNSYGASTNFRVMVVVRGTLSTDDRQKLEGWIMHQVGDKNSLPSGHPYKNIEFTYPNNEFLFDFGTEDGGRVPPAPYNNISTPSVGLTSGSSISNIINTKFIPTEVDVEIVSSFTQTNGNQRGLEGDSNLPFDWTAVRDGYQATGGDTGTIKLSNLNPDKAYDFIIYGSRGFIGGESNYEARGQNTKSVSLLTQDNGLNNTYITAKIEGITPDINNEIELDTVGYINALKVSEKHVDSLGNPYSFFDVYRDFSNAGNFTLDAVSGDKWLESAPNEILSNEGSSNGEEIFSNNTTQHASSNGWKVLSNGVQILGSEISIKVRMYDGTDENGLNHSSSEDFLLVYVEYHQGGMSENRRKEGGGPSDKLQTNNPKNWKHSDNYFTDTGGVTPASDDGVQLPLGFDPTNGTYMMFAKMRDLTNNRYYQWVIELVSGNSTSSDMYTADTVSQSIIDEGQAWYIVSGLADEDDGDTLEHYFQENTILQHYGYKKMTPSEGNFELVDSFIRAWADSLMPD